MFRGVRVLYACARGGAFTVYRIFKESAGPDTVDECTRLHCVLTLSIVRHVHAESAAPLRLSASSINRMPCPCRVRPSGPPPRPPPHSALRPWSAPRSHKFTLLSYLQPAVRDREVSTVHRCCQCGDSKADGEGSRDGEESQDDNSERRAAACAPAAILASSVSMRCWRARTRDRHSGVRRVPDKGAAPAREGRALRASRGPAE
jgi:hypothetical protein